MKIELTNNDHFREGTYFSKRFDCGMTVSSDLDNSVSDEYIERCVDAAELFSDEMINTINEAAKRYALAFIEEIKEETGEDFSFEDEDLPEITEDTPASEMPEYFHFNELSADKPEHENQLYFRLSGGCDWESEHGLEAAFCDGKLINLGSFEQATPHRVDYFISGKGREWNYAIKGE